MYSPLEGSNPHSVIVATLGVRSLAIGLCTWLLPLFCDRKSSLKDARLFFILLLLSYFGRDRQRGPVVSLTNYAAIESVLFLLQRSMHLLLSEKRVYQASKEQSDSSVDKLLKPRIFPSRTTHHRTFPKVHSFSFSYLMVGIPIGWHGTISSMISTDTNMIDTSKPSYRIAKGWFQVDAVDYLDRGNAHLGLHGKLRAYIESQGECPIDYPKAYLVTAPRFLGYSFNPVSFWYLYGQDRQLKAMILEVNNTFDERRLYFLKNSNEEIGPPQADELTKNSELSLKPLNSLKSPAKFTNTWRKDFHVSPFNSRKGSYRLTAHDPFATNLTKPGFINNTITLRSSKAHAKLVARIFSTEPSIDPSVMSSWQKIGFIASWWWVGFLTFPRIVREAGKLFFRRKLHVWYRPEVLRESIGRKETERERYDNLKSKCFLTTDNIQSHRSTIPQLPQVPRRAFLSSFLPQIHCVRYLLLSRRSLLPFFSLLQFRTSDHRSL